MLSLIVKRNIPIPHYELHYIEYVEFRTIEGKLLGRSKVEDVE